MPSDLDVAILFDPDDPRSRGDRAFGLRSALEKACGMSVDLLETEAARNPYLLRELDETEVVLYEAP
ncbi:MAG: nucleotidyltransferase domain-containing protein [Actinomycetota bacterium]|nr:nucleotidyltransferase domain-containing protein [Actinomycetota bacterium]